MEADTDVGALNPEHYKGIHLTLPLDRVNFDPANQVCHVTIQSIELIDACGFGFHLGNAQKYLHRAGKKNHGKRAEDIRKAAWMLSRFATFVLGKTRAKLALKAVFYLRRWAYSIENGQDKVVPLVYVAGPFRPKVEHDCYEMEENIRRAEGLALKVWLEDAAAICPHANTRFFQGAANASDAVWLDGDLEMLYRCDAILMTPDWETSSGAREEKAEAERWDIPVFYSIDQLREWIEKVRAMPVDLPG